MTNIIHAKIICEDEARQVGQELLQRLRELLKGVTIDLSDLIIKVSKKVKKRLEKIQEIAKSLKEEVENDEFDNLNTNNLDKDLKAIIELVEDFKGDEGFMASLIMIETNMVIAHFKNRLIVEMKSIIEGPEKALPYIGIDFNHKRKIMAEKFQVWFPKFLGYRVDVRSDPQVMIIRLTGEPPIPEELARSPTIILKPEAEEFIVWELRKWGYSMEYDINTYDDGVNKLVTCEFNLVAPEENSEF